MTMYTPNHLLKVLQIGPLPPPLGGMATVVENLASSLTSFCEVRILNNVKTTPVNRSLRQGVASQLHLLTRLVRLCLIWRPQIVHIHTCSWFTFWRSSADVVLARALARRVVLHIHGGEFKVFLESLSPSMARLARLILSACSRVIVLGQTWKDLLDCWCDPAKVVIVANGVAIQPMRILSKGNVFTVVCMANYCRLKGQADLLRAVVALKSTQPIHVALLGSEAEVGHKQKFVSLAAELGLADKVDIPGPVTGTEKERWWARANCFCLPSYKEGLPMAMLEAMARGVPVIATRAGTIPEAVEDHREGLLYEPGDIPGLTSLLQELLANPANAESIGRAGRERLIRDFSLEQSINQLLHVYRDLTPGRRRKLSRVQDNHGQVIVTKI